MKRNVMKLHKNPLPPDSPLEAILARQLEESKVSRQGTDRWVNSYYATFTNFLKQCQKEIKEYYERPKAGGTEV
jgi:hypothetical protein